MSKVRIINSKTGDVKFVSPMVAKDTKQLKAYGYVVQDLEKKEVVTEIETITKDIEDLEEELEAPLFDNLVDEQPTIERKKPGPKPKQVTE